MESVRARPFEANCCDMPSPAPRVEAEIYRSLREGIVRAHCADKRPAHKCAGTITIDRETITFQCPRCGDARQTLTEPEDDQRTSHLAPQAPR